mmetsp:Transcript_58927/g.113642  ORF Transcript_58927/g.113642 Transcript_58927/m.113642 type:complete len:127 (+) Transcript_58927:186-566(+)
MLSLHASFQAVLEAESSQALPTEQDELPASALFDEIIDVPLDTRRRRGCGPARLARDCVDSPAVACNTRFSLMRRSLHSSVCAADRNCSCSCTAWCHASGDVASATALARKALRPGRKDPSLQRWM